MLLICLFIDLLVCSFVCLSVFFSNLIKGDSVLPNLHVLDFVLSVVCCLLLLLLMVVVVCVVAAAAAAVIVVVVVVVVVCCRCFNILCVWILQGGGWKP